MNRTGIGKERCRLPGDRIFVAVSASDGLLPASRAHSARSGADRDTIGDVNDIAADPGGVQSSGNGDGPSKTRRTAALGEKERAMETAQRDVWHALRFASVG